MLSLSDVSLSDVVVVVVKPWRCARLLMLADLTLSALDARSECGGRHGVLARSGFTH